MPPSAARDFHDATRHAREHTIGGRMRPLGSAWRPPQQKGYAGGVLLPFAERGEELALPALTALGERGPLERRTPTRADLERLCHLSNGVLRWRSRTGAGQAPFGFRAAPCTGALYHVELYLASADLDGLPAGLYHHDAAAPGLRRLRAGDQRAAVIEAAAGEPAVARAPVTVLLTSAFWRNAWKYGPRAYRHTYWDGGVVLANLLAAARALGLPAKVVLGFVDGRVERLLDLDPEREAPFALLALGAGGPPAPPAPEPAPLDLEDEPLFAFAERFPQIPAAHAATSLAGVEQVAAWRASAPGGPAFSGDGVPGGGVPGGGPSIEKAIVGRRSTRGFAGDPIGEDQLGALLDCALAPVAADVALGPGSVHLVVNAVEGMEPGLYRLDGGRRVPIRTALVDQLRAAGGRMTLDQALGAEAAVDVCFLADLDQALETMGDRGWRAVHLGAAIAAGRLEVAAQALGLGATGLTFYDDEVVELFGLDPRRTAVTYLAAAGVPRGRRRRRETAG